MTLNPYLAARVERYNAQRAHIDEMQTRAHAEGRDLSPAEVSEVRAAAEEASALADELGPDMDLHERTAAVARLAGTLAGPGAVSLGHVEAPDDYATLGGRETVPNLMPPAPQLAEMFRALDGQSPRRWTVEQGEDVHNRAALTTTTIGVGTLGSAGQPLREPRRISTAVDLPVERVSGVESVTYPVFAAGTADIDTEGTTKQEYDAVTAGTATPQVIAVWSDFTRQGMLSMPAFETRLRAKHAALVAKREDTLLVARLNAVSGSQTYVGTTGTTPDYADSLLAACGLVLSSDVAAPPDIILVNPNDLPLIFPAAETRGVNGSAPDSVMRLDLFGATVYPTAAVTAGTAIVAALAASSRFVVGLPPTVLIDPVSGLKSNLITMLTEEAVTLAIHEPTGVVLADLVPPAS